MAYLHSFSKLEMCENLRAINRTTYGTWGLLLAGKFDAKIGPADQISRDRTTYWDALTADSTIQWPRMNASGSLYHRG